jgi:hypothetical protein
MTAPFSQRIKAFGFASAEFRRDICQPKRRPLLGCFLPLLHR